MKPASLEDQPKPVGPSGIILLGSLLLVLGTLLFASAAWVAAFTAAIINGVADNTLDTMLIGIGAGVVGLSLLGYSASLRKLANHAPTSAAGKLGHVLLLAVTGTLLLTIWLATIGLSENSGLDSGLALAGANMTALTLIFAGSTIIPMLLEPATREDDAPIRYAWIWIPAFLREAATWAITLTIGLLAGIPIAWLMSQATDQSLPIILASLLATAIASYTWRAHKLTRDGKDRIQIRAGVQTMILSLLLVLAFGILASNITSAAACEIDGLALALALSVLLASTQYALITFVLSVGARSAAQQQD